MELPVFQMIIQQNENGSIYLSFSEESEDFVQPVFVIPSSYPNEAWWKSKYYMPGEIYGKYVEFDLEVQEDRQGLLMKIESKTVRFNFFDLADTLMNGVYRKYLIKGYSKVRYSGSYEKFIYPFSDFIIVCPVDLIVMDHLFLNYGASFVGLTPIFGNKREY